MSPAAPPLAIDHQYADINGIRMHYVEAGQGEPVVFLHGFPESWYSWRHQLAALQHHYHVIAPDLRGYNETEARGPYDTETLQDDVEALIRHLGHDGAHIIAHDWGGMIAWLLAIKRPALVRSLVVCNLPHPEAFRKNSRSFRQLRKSWYVFFFQLPWLPERFLRRDDYRNLARVLIRDCRPGTFTRDDVKHFLESWRRQGLGPGVNWYRALLRKGTGVPSPVPTVTAPTTLIWGENDRALGKELNDGTEDLVTDLTVHFLPNASHWVQQEEPALVNRYILEHFRRVRDRG
ncbi:MAG: alpha/beta hydrolase [Dehalococcoidia bacterium]